MPIAALNTALHTINGLPIGADVATGDCCDIAGADMPGMPKASMTMSYACVHGILYNGT